VNYYEVLGASPMDQLDRIEDLFRQLAYDAETSGDHSKVPLAVEAFKVLRDPAKRHQYDQQLAHQQSLAAASQNQQAQLRQPHPSNRPLNQAAAAPAQHQPTPSDPMPAQPQPAQYQPTPSQPMPTPEQLQVAQSQVMPPEQPAASIPNVQPPAPQQAPVVAPSSAQAAAQESPEFCAETTQRQRREILAMFYKRRRDDAKNPGIAIGGLEQKVEFSYEVLEFHLWFMQQREWLLRLESGMFTITYAGVEEHEKNLIEGLIR
jgi:DNA primase